VCQSVAAVAATCVHDILQSCASRGIPCDTKVQAQKFQMLLGFLQMLWRLLTVAQLLNETISCWIRYMVKEIMISTEIYSYLNSSAHLHNI
jgi:hypothetical protein